MVERCPDKTEVDGPIPSTLTLHPVLIYFIMNQSHGAFIFMEENKDNLTENGLPIEKAELSDLPNQDLKSWWRPILIFYIKTTSWIVFPLLFGVIAGAFVGKSIGSQTLFFAFVMLGFGITCFGLYREVRNYKKELDKKDGK